LALFAHLLTMMIIGFMVPNPFEFLIIQVIGGMSVIFSIVNLRKRSQLFITIALLFAVYLVCYVGITLMLEGQTSAIKLQNIGWLGASAALTLFSYPLIYLFEKLFGFTSDVSLLELSDTNNPLLKELALKAPGTFQHSLQVANLAEAAINRIGGNTLLTRTGALYHDIGKMELARYFIENQLTGINPHDELGFDESARIIISHVKRGIQLGRKYNLPEKIVDFIRTHHGTSRVQYFYRSFLKSYPNLEIDEAAFRYPGPIPYSRETAVVMMADSVEATSRSLKDVTSEKIDTMVEEIINQQIADNQFINADITFKDISRIKKILKKMLMNIYHVRVEYPK
jgi:putative nucleotidyltransferase with HDIG domain